MPREVMPVYQAAKSTALIQQLSTQSDAMVRDATTLTDLTTRIQALDTQAGAAQTTEPNGATAAQGG